MSDRIEQVRELVAAARRVSRGDLTVQYLADAVALLADEVEARPAGWRPSDLGVSNVTRPAR